MPRWLCMISLLTKTFAEKLPRATSVESPSEEVVSGFNDHCSSGGSTQTAEETAKEVVVIVLVTNKPKGFSLPELRAYCRYRVLRKNHYAQQDFKVSP